MRLMARAEKQTAIEIHEVGVRSPNDDLEHLVLAVEKHEKAVIGVPDAELRGRHEIPSGLPPKVFVRSSSINPREYPGQPMTSARYLSARRSPFAVLKT
jgi:hypothetical protein